jgi:hypothetical protein
VIPRRDIPVSPTSDDGNFEVQPFSAHELLNSMLPPSAVSVASTQARSGQDVGLPSHPTPGLIIILEGWAILIGRLHRKVEASDVITLPCEGQEQTALPPFCRGGLGPGIREPG